MAHHTEQPDEVDLTLLCAIPEMLDARSGRGWSGMQWPLDA